MNLQQAKITLEKINRLYQSMTLDASNIDVFEQDLMLSYIKQLYDSFSPGEVANIAKKPSRRSTPVITPPPPVSPVVEVEEIKVPPVKPLPPIKEEIPAAKVVPTEAPKPKVVEVSPEVQPVKPPVVETVPTPQATPPKPSPTPATPLSKPNPATNPDHEVLFEQQEAKELSEKLSAQPIRDLNKAMGINERFLTINELFSQDNRAYQAAIDQLNSLKTFEEAKAVLSDLAEKHGWTKRGKKKKAQIFIKLVRRRYN